MKKSAKTYSLLSLLSFLLISLLFTTCVNGQENDTQNDLNTTWAEKLGYPEGKKVIILHADDAGMSEGANIATAHYLTNNQIQSTAVMAPCPSADEFIQWAINHPDTDVGMHLTHTSEWKTYRWGPVSDPADVPGLIDPDGMLWHEVPDVVMHASADEVEIEIRAQIEKAISMGYNPNHMDTHMGTLYGHADYVERFLKVAEEYGIPANVIDLSDPQVASQFKAAGYPIDDHVVGLIDQYTLPKLDNFTSAPHGQTYEEKIENFKVLIQSLPAGLTEIIFHPSVESEELKSITNSWQQRVWEAKMFSDPDLISFFEEEEIIFTNWIEIMNRFSDRHENRSESSEWISLFNGENLDGWTVRGKANWRVKDGIMIGQSNDGTGHIYAGPELTDLEVKGVFRLSDQGGGGNSGLYFRSNPPEDNPDGYPVGYEAQICHNQDAHTGWLWKPGTPTGKASALLTSDDEWFSMRVKATGSLIQIWVNEKLVMTYEDEEYPKGFFAIQCHNPGMTIESKELYFRDLIN
jgi:predicted glycoside hydrolase/deacetylase ChbG (UPF0249 family)